MKVVDIAAKNRVSSEHVMEICKDLGISYENDNSDISDNDVFLVGKKIEVIKEKRATETLELIEKKTGKADKDKNQKKIKLKRKVHISRGVVKHPNSPDKSKDEKKEIKDNKDLKDDKKQEIKQVIKQEIKQEKEKVPHKVKPKTAVSKPTPKDIPDTIEKKKSGKTSEETGTAQAGKFQKKRKKGKEKEREWESKKKFVEKDIQIKKKKAEDEPKILTPKVIEITESISVGEMAKKLNVKAKDLIAKLMNMGVMATITEAIDSETAEILASEFNTEVKVVSLFEDTIIKTEQNDKEEDYIERPPVVTIMGHVDHGKTKLLDAIRKTNIINQEIGGITQHIGAYMVKTGDNYITFLDTPGHESFTTMRARGASITDIVVLVVAADDGVMPQTIEAINHAKDADVPTVVAINKIDLPDANIQKVKQEVSNYGLVPEEWGGNTLFVEISAKNGINIDNLLELILVQAEVLELKANPKLMAVGTVVEARLDQGRGSVATVLVQNGTLNIGTPFVVGIYSGKARAMYNDKGEFIKQASPSVPVEVVGMTGVPSAGDPFQMVGTEKYAKHIAQNRQEHKRIESAKKVKKVTLENVHEMIKDGEIKELRVIIKGDVDGSVQALKESLEKLSNDEVRVKTIHAGAGGINESDVMLASASNAIIIGYHVRPSTRVNDLAAREMVSIKFYNIIFEATNDIKSALEGMLSPDIIQETTGSGEIKQIFKISKIGVIAGALVISGKVNNNNRVRLIRDGVVVFDGKIKSLKRYKDEVSVVEANQECGFSIEGFNDIKEGDNFETYKIMEVAKILK